MSPRMFPLVIVFLLGAAAPARARYVHDDPNGRPHPGCLPAGRRAQRDLGLPDVAPFNTSCPGKPMREVFDWDTEIIPFNFEKIGTALTRFQADSGFSARPEYEPLVPVSVQELGEPPASFTELTYTRGGADSTSNIDELNDDIKEAAFDMYLDLEDQNLVAFIAAEDAASINKPSTQLELAVRAAFNQHLLDGGMETTSAIDDPAGKETSLNNVLRNRILRLRKAREYAAYEAYITDNDYSYFPSTNAGEVVNRLNNVNTRNKQSYDAEYVSRQDTALQSWLTSKGLDGKVTASITSVTQDMAALNADIDSQARAAWKSDRASDLATYLANAGLAGEGLPGIDDAIADIAAYRTRVREAARAKYLRDSGLASEGVTAAEFGDGSTFDYAAHHQGDKDDHVAAENADLQSWLTSKGLDGKVTASITSVTQDMAALNADIDSQARAAWKSDRASDLATYLANAGLAGEGLPGIDDAIADIAAYRTRVREAARAKYLRDSGLASEGVTAAEFGDGSTFDYAALNFTGAQYGGDPSPEFSVTPAYTAPGNFVPATSYSYNFDGVHYGGDPSPEFTVSPYPSPGNYNSLPYAFNQYALTLTHSVPSYSLSTPATFNVTRFEWPAHITKQNFTGLSVHHKQWHSQRVTQCQATCAGSVNSNADRDLDDLAADRTCDADDVLCPSSNAAPEYQELSQIVDAVWSESGVHPQCPVPDPCVVAPPPCFYVSTECVPRQILDTQLNNSALRASESLPSTDERYLHEPLDLSSVVTWKLVSKTSRKFMEYSKALDMEPWTSPIDNRPYHKVCTFRLTQKNPRHYGASMQYGFSIGEADAKEIEGDTQAGQNSAGEPNHVYDVGHIAGREMWQRSFGEVVSPELDGACSQRFAGAWQNRKYNPAQTSASQNYVFGTCMKTCDAMTELGLRMGHPIDTYPAFLGAQGARTDEPETSSYAMPRLGAGVDAEAPAAGGVGAAAAVLTVLAAAAVAVAVRKRAANASAAEERAPLIASTV